MPKNRGQNYTEREKQDLINIFNKYKHIIENKKTDSMTTKQKNDCWAEIAQEYNGCVDRPREIEQLKYCYTNIKRTKKKHCAFERGKEYIENQRKSSDPAMVLKMYNEMKSEAKEKSKQDKVESIKTGGGTYSSTFTETDSLILSVCPGQFEPLANIYDDATVYFKDTAAISHEVLTTNESIEQCNQTIPENNINSTYDKITNVHLETNKKITAKQTVEDSQVHNKLVDMNKNDTPRKKSTFKDELLKYTNQRKRKIEEETNLTKVYNEKKIELITLQIQQLKEEHEIKMKILKLDLKLKENQLNCSVVL